MKISYAKSGIIYDTAPSEFDERLDEYTDVEFAENEWAATVSNKVAGKSLAKLEINLTDKLVGKTNTELLLDRYATLSFEDTGEYTSNCVRIRWIE